MVIQVHDGEKHLRRWIHFCEGEFEDKWNNYMMNYDSYGRGWRPENNSSTFIRCPYCWTPLPTIDKDGNNTNEYKATGTHISAKEMQLFAMLIQYEIDNTEGGEWKCMEEHEVPEYLADLVALQKRMDDN